MSRICPKAIHPLLAAMLLVSVDLVRSGSPGGGPKGALKLTSSAFQAETTIPKKHTCDGQDFSPPLAWSDPPPGTKAFALILDDPDAPGGTWVHWVLYDLPGDARNLPENVPKTSELANGARQGRNDFPRIGYGGPCPPHGPAHRYVFKLYALDGTLGLQPGLTKARVEKAMEGHVLGQTQLIGRYGR